MSNGNSQTPAPDQVVNPMVTSDLVTTSSPGVSLASQMIAASQSQSRAMEASVAHLNQTYLVGLATATQCVARILNEPSDQLRQLDALITANSVD
jgi:hypothetical protein